MTTRRTLLMSALATASVTALSACGASDDASSAGTAGTSTSAASYPITITHALGTTTIEKAPERIATVGWANHEVPLALGVVPVGMSKATFGDTDGDGMLPWVKSKLTELGAATPVLFDETDGVDLEAVADTTPDVILAAYSGLTAEEYEKLSKIAPTIAYPKVAWTTTLDEMISLDGQGMGRAADAEALAKTLNETIATKLADHADLKGLTAMFAYIDSTDMSKIGYYTNHDPRAAFLYDQLGFTMPATVKKGSDDETVFYQTISAEQGDQLDDVDLIIGYGDAATLKTWQSDKLLARVRALKAGAVAMLGNDTALAASSNPSPLAIDSTLDEYLALLSAAAKKVA